MADLLEAKKSCNAELKVTFHLCKPFEMIYCIVMQKKYSFMLLERNLKLKGLKESLQILNLFALEVILAMIMTTAQVLCTGSCEADGKPTQTKSLDLVHWILWKEQPEQPLTYWLFFADYFYLFPVSVCLRVQLPLSKKA